MPATCDQCGSPASAEGNCQVCLLQLGVSSAGASHASSPHSVVLPPIEQLNAQFPQLNITHLIGRGGMGAVYHARQKALDRNVALKLIAREVADNTGFIERFEREARTLAKLSHPNIVTVFDFGRTTDGMAYLIMEFVDGINLREALQSKSIGPDDALAVVSTICKALAYAHSKGVVHRDIKPENILLGEDGTLKVADFGIAKLLDEPNESPALTATRQVLGSLHYLAPEQLEAPSEVDHRVDLYALGVIFYELLTGQLPLGRYEPPSALGGKIDPRVDPIVLKTLNRRPAQRYQQAADIDSDIFDLRTNQPHVVAPDASGSLCVPFTAEALGGFAEVVGMLHATREQLRIEYRTRDAILGQLTSKIRTIDVPASKLLRAELHTGIFGCKMVLAADTISTFENFPKAETGQVVLRIKRTDREQAAAVINTLDVRARDVAVGLLGTAPTPTELPQERTRWMVLAVLLMLCAVINAGMLAIIQVINVNTFSDQDSVIAVIATAVLLAPVLLLQLVTGSLSLVARPRSLAVATSIVSLIPITPGWLISFPVGLWALSWLRVSESRPLSVRAAGATGSKNWGATTLMFIRESRWSKFLALANAAALLVALGGLALYQTGYYPTTLVYRVVEPNADRWGLQQAIRARLPDGSSVVVEGRERSSNIIAGDDHAARRVRVGTLQRNRESTRQLLAIERNVQLIWLDAQPAAAGEDADATPRTIRTNWNVTSGLDLPASVTQQRAALGDQVASVGEPLTLRSEWVSRVSSESPRPLQVEPNGRLVRQVAIEFSLTGRKLIDASAPDPSRLAGLALVVDGVVHGYARPEMISSTHTVFALAGHPDVTSAALIAAIRGPELPAELELLD